MGGLISSMLSMFYEKRLDMVVVGLAGSGKTTFANMLNLGRPLETVPTIGLNVQTFKKQGVSCKLWDLGGQQEFRSEWKMYALHTDIIVFLVDTQQPYDIYLSKRELHVILEQLQKPTPILVLANKIDLGPQISQEEIIEGLNLDYIHDHPWLVIPVSAKSGENVNQALEFMLKYAK